MNINMTLNEYQQLAARTINKDIPNRERIFHGVFGLASEAGEVAGLFQKKYQGHDIDVPHLIKELGDCMWMIAEIATELGVDLGLVGANNIDKLIARYPDGFNAEQSMHRKEGDV